MNKIILLFLIFFMQCVCFANEYLPYDYSDTRAVAIKLSPVREISTSDEIYEGQEVEFKVRRNVYVDGFMFLPKDTIIKARIETIITKGMNGFPAELIIDNFKIDNVHQTQLLSNCVKAGRNYALLVYPIKWILTPIPFVGSLTNLIQGGQARLKTDDVITIYYYPYWK